MRLRISLPNLLLTKLWEHRGNGIEKCFISEDFKGQKVVISVNFSDDRTSMQLEGDFKTSRQKETEVNIKTFVEEIPNEFIHNKPEHCYSSHTSHSFETETNPQQNTSRLNVIYNIDNTTLQETVHNVSDSKPDNVNCNQICSSEDEVLRQSQCSDSEIDNDTESLEVCKNKDQSMEYEPANECGGASVETGHSQPSGFSTGDSQYVCSVCGARFKQKQLTLFRRHIRSKHKNSEIALKDAQQQKQRLLKKNAITVKKEPKPKKLPEDKLGKCEFCHKLFRHVNDHRTLCRQNPDHVIYFYCPCGFRSCDSFLTNDHKRNCTRRKLENVCELCGKMFKTRGGLSGHRRNVHQLAVVQSKPVVAYKCQTCDKEFFMQSHLKRHENMHSDKRDHVCETCGKSFKDKSTLRRHHNTIHDNKYAYRCLKCGHGMEKKGIYLRHKCGRSLRRMQCGTTIQSTKEVKSLVKAAKTTRSAAPKETMFHDTNTHNYYSTEPVYEELLHFQPVGPSPTCT